MFGRCNFEEDGATLIGQRYKIHHARRRDGNPIEKAPFLVGEIAALVEMQLMTSTIGWPAIEMLNENDPAQRFDVGPGFIPFLAQEGPGGEAPSMPRSFEAEPASAKPFRYCSTGQVGTFALVAPCHDLGQALDIWRFLGLEVRNLDRWHASVRIPHFLMGPSLTLFYVKALAEKPVRSLNARGVVCLSLLCSDADALRESLIARGFELGDSFELSPFGQALQICFMRNRTGEILEFISPKALPRSEGRPGSPCGETTGH
jgi:hypothetical protein